MPWPPQWRLCVRASSLAERQAPQNAAASNWKIAPDPLPLTPVQFQRLTTAPPPSTGDRVEFLLFGGLGPHKGLFEIMETLQLLAPEIAGRVRIRFLGRWVEGGEDAYRRFRALVAGAHAQTGADVVFEDRYASEDDIIDAMIGGDVMLATRRHHPGVSNNLIWSAAAGRPVISQDSGWMGHITARENLGIVCDPLDPKAIAAAMSRALDPEWRAAFDVAGPRAFAAGYTAEGYYETVIGALAGAHTTTADVAKAA